MLPDATFEAITGTPRLEPGEIHVWHVAWPRTMPPRAVSAATRGEVLGRLMAYAGLVAPPRIEPGAHGKPVVPDVPGIDFNISHSGTDVLVAFARQQPLGIDIESLDRPRTTIDGIAERFFAKAEAAALARLPALIRQRAFIALWTHKEAILKATGEGIGSGLDRVEFSIDESGGIGELVSLPLGFGRREDWRFLAFAPAATLIAALAWQGPPRPVRGFVAAPRPELRHG